MPVESSLLTGPLLIVAPELGEAALSCSALLAREQPVTVLDVFTLVPEPDHASDWDRACGFMTATDAMATREREEAHVFANTVHEVLAVDLLAQRYRRSLRTEADERRLRDAVLGWVGRADGGTVVLPAGAGLPPGVPLGVGTGLRTLLGGRDPLTVDPDHLWVRDAVIKAVRGHPGVRLGLYEELPHLRSRSADGAVALVARWLGRGAQPVVLPVDRTVKVQRIAAYGSLVRARFGVRSTRRLRRRVPGRERYWLLEPVAATVST